MHKAFRIDAEPVMQILAAASTAQTPDLHAWKQLYRCSKAPLLLSLSNCWTKLLEQETGEHLCKDQRYEGEIGQEDLTPC